MPAALLTFGWGLYGQCGQGNNADQLRPTLDPSLLGTGVEKIAAGLWHTLCVTVDGQIYAFGGNQFGQLGASGDQPETRGSMMRPVTKGISYWTRTITAQRVGKSILEGKKGHVAIKREGSWLGSTWDQVLRE